MTLAEPGIYAAISGTPWTVTGSGRSCSTIRHRHGSSPSSRGTFTLHAAADHVDAFAAARGPPLVADASLCEEVVWVAESDL